MGEREKERGTAEGRGGREPLGESSEAWWEGEEEGDRETGIRRKVGVLLRLPSQAAPTDPIREYMQKPHIRKRSTRLVSSDHPAGAVP